MKHQIAICVKTFNVAAQMVEKLFVQHFLKGCYQDNYRVLTATFYVF